MKYPNQAQQIFEYYSKNPQASEGIRAGIFEDKVLKSVLASEKSCMVVSSTTPLPEKDFKAVIEDGRIKKVGIEFFENAMAAQALYKFDKSAWMVWLDKIKEFCENGNTKCYAENAFNEISDKCELYPLDVKDILCNEIDDENDLAYVLGRLKELLS